MGCTLPAHMLPYIANTFPPQCSTCNITLSIEHILLHCVSYREERQPLAAYCRGRGLPLTQSRRPPFWVTNIRMWSID
ncbi:hypothetical protein E2C01_056334 [Portunus trituberculatus]|uniref:Reverse transcriptase zinc-binding domain-containing protein n=1 Tax=Portunus trituberculatus TaxID=210409 RepID=A0A5B7GQ28_PORTR|nr:hypothetical protein [Portunus trituberculatus]